jgi:two-component system phosphate regulon sensor histidine kinase PhoR
MNSRLSTQALVCAEVLVLGSVAFASILTTGVSAFVSGGFWIGIVLSGLVTAIVVRIAANRWSRAIEQLTQGVSLLAKQDFDQRFRADAGEETRRLSAALEELRVVVGEKRDEMRDELDLNHTILQGMTEGVIAVDETQRITLANKACGRLLRMATPDLVGRPLLEATRSRPLYDAVLLALSRPGPLTSEFDVGDSPKRSLLLRAVRLPGNPSAGVVVVLHDVSEIRRLENVRKEFVANVSHELKTPLASIKAYAETLSNGAVNDPSVNLTFVKRIEEDAERLHQLIIDMLQIARIESHQQAFNITRVVIDDAVHRCIEQMQPHAAAKQLALVAEAPPTPLAIDIDDEGLQTILANLVDNAIKYTNKGSVTVRWWSESETAIVQVRDTGIGISEADQSRIFERFYRVDQARTRGVGGTGLGLSIVKHLVQAFRGDVSLVSRWGVGSKFEVRLPLKSSNANAGH